MRRSLAPACLPVSVLLAALLVLATWSLLAPARASAAEAYTNVAFTTCNGATQGGGSYDADGTLYLSCKNVTAGVTKYGVFIKPYNAAGRFLDLGAGYADLAPSPHGEFLYTSGAVKRLVRQANGTYVADAAWKLQQFTFAGKLTSPNAATLTTDAWGDIYVDNCCAPNPTMVEKYHPDGTLVTSFGDWTSTAELGKFNLNMGIGTTRDGRSIYVVEKTGGRVQRFDVNADGVGYHFAVAWGHPDTTACSPGNFAAPGDVNVDAWGYVYVMDTSCQRIQKFTADGTFLYARIVGKSTNNNLGRSHKFGVTIDGNVFIGENTNENIVRATPVPGPWPTLVPLPKPPVTVTPLGMCPGEDWTNGAGQVGADGTAIVACKTSLLVIADGGVARGRIAMPAGARYYDVAPSPDWSVLYVTRVTDVDPVTGLGGLPELLRMTRVGAVGSLTYAVDPNWRPASFVMGGVSWTPMGRYIATDDYGDLFFSNGGWAGRYDAAGNFYPVPAAAAVVEYRPDGSVMTAFHGGAATGEFDVNMGLAVSRDGRTVWEVEHVAGRVQRFDWEIDGEYRQNVSATKTFGATDTTCAQPTGFAAPYDLGIDPWGNVYVTSVSCRQVKKFRPDGTLLWVAAVPALTHGIVVDRHGNVYAPASNVWLKRNDAEDGPVPAVGPRPVPDVIAPTVSTVTLPAATLTQSVTLAVAAADDATGTGVTSMRIASEDGNWGAWIPFAASSQYLLSAGYGGKVVSVQVRDGAGHESNVVSATTTFQRIVDTQPPVLVSETLPASFAGPTVTVVTVATDDTGVTEMRLANEDGIWGNWIPYSASAVQTVTAGLTNKVISVQVRDGAGNESNSLYRTTLRTA